MEVVHAIAPAAGLDFATADGGEMAMADNITAMSTLGDESSDRRHRIPSDETVISSLGVLDDAIQTRRCGWRLVLRLSETRGPADSAAPRTGFCKTEIGTTTGTPTARPRPR